MFDQSDGLVHERALLEVHSSSLGSGHEQGALQASARVSWIIANLTNSALVDRDLSA